MEDKQVTFLLILPLLLRRRLRAVASLQGVTMTQYIVNKLTEAVEADHDL